MESARDDGLGHWPKGKRRNADTGDWATVRLGIQALLDQHDWPGVISLGAIADALGVSKKSVQKWLKGVTRPSEESQDMLRVWLQQTRAKLDARKRAARA